MYYTVFAVLSFLGLEMVVSGLRGLVAEVVVIELTSEFVIIVGENQDFFCHLTFDSEFISLCCTIL